MNWPGTCSTPEGQSQHGLSLARYEAISLIPFLQATYAHSASMLCLGQPQILTGNNCCGICCSLQKPVGPRIQGRERRRSGRPHPPTPGIEQRQRSGPRPRPSPGQRPCASTWLCAETENRLSEFLVRMATYQVQTNMTDCLSFRHKPMPWPQLYFSCFFSSLKQHCRLNH